MLSPMKRPTVVQIRLSPEEAELLDSRRAAQTRSAYLRSLLAVEPVNDTVDTVPEAVVETEAAEPEKAPRKPRTRKKAPEAVETPPVADTADPEAAESEPPGHRHRRGKLVHSFWDKGSLVTVYACTGCGTELSSR